MAQGGLARKEASSNTYTDSPSINTAGMQSEPKRLALSGFEKLLIGIGVCLTFCLLVTIVSTKNAINVSQRSLQKVTSQNSRLNDENQSMKQALDGMENDAINHVVKKDNLSIANSNTRDVAR